MDQNQSTTRRAGLWQLRAAVWGIAALLAAGGTAFAQETQPTLEPKEPGLEEVPGNPDHTIVVTGSRQPERALETPYSVDVVGRQQLVDKQYRNAPEALQDIPGVMVQKTSHGQGSPFIRGFTGFRTLLLVDGIRLNNSSFRDGPNQYFGTVDAQSVDRFEVVKGPSSVLYGSDAIGGTVNAITKSPYGYNDGNSVHFNLLNRGSSAERSYTGRPEVVFTANQKFGLLAGGTYMNYGDLEGGDDIGRQEETGYDQWAGDAKFEYFLAPNQRLVFAHQRSQMNNASRSHATIYGFSFAGTTIGTDLQRDFDQYRDLTYVQYHADQLNGPISRISASLSWQNQYEREDRVRGNGAASDTEFNVGTLGAWVQLTSPTPIGELTYGIEYYRDNVSSRSSANPVQGVIADDATYDLLGVYIQDRIPIGNQFEVTIGGRFTYAAADANSVLDPVTGDKTSIDDDWTSVVGSLRAAYFIVPEHWTVFGGVSQGFRAPNLSDLTRFDIARSGEREIPSPDLEPEDFISYEIGVKAEYDNFAIQAAYFYTDINNAIVRRPTGEFIGTNAVVSKENAGDGYVQGVELGLSWRFHPDFTFFTSATWQDGEVDQFPTSGPEKDREPISKLIPTTGIFGVRWDSPNRKFWVEGQVNIVASQNDLNTADLADTQRIPPGGTPSYELFGIRGGWNVNENARLILAVENIFDEDYRVHGSGVNGPGRNFIGTLELRF